MEAVEVAEVWWSGSTTTSRTFERAVAALEASDADYAEPRVGDTTEVGPLTIEMVNPPEGVDLSDIHDASLAMRVTFGEVRVLFTGDAEAATEQRMVATSAELLDADIYQVGHHGSSTSTTGPFLDAVDPTVAIWSASVGNQYGHPHQEVVDRLDAAGVVTYGTAVNGTVTVTTDGTEVTVEPERGDSYTFTVDGSAPGPAPDPDEPAFTDIVGTTHERAIVAVADEGIAGGFPDNTFRPGQAVTRGQMATFLNRAVDLPPYEPDGIDDGDPQCVDINTATSDLLQLIVHIGPERAQAIIDGRPWASIDQLDQISGIGPARLDDIRRQGLAQTSCPDQHGPSLPVSDVAGTTHADSILAVIQAGIAAGFPDGTYRPGQPVTRGQMATFLTRTFDLPAGDTNFPDAEGTTHADAIAAVAAAGITGGFPDGTYRPGQPVTRGQMATFLARALELVPSQ